MVEWLNKNQGAVMAVLTVVYVVATVLMAWLMRRNLSLLSQLEQRRSRPYVIFDLVAKDHVVRAVVRNSGLTAANGVVLQVTPPLVRDGRESPLINHEIAYLPPSRELSDFVDSGPAFFERYPEARFQGEVTYRDADGARDLP